ncbi:MAG: heavy metal-binding domain-containing protein [Cyclobacteriaceae bacterium]|jgi:hypothetical protein|nr:hypothetical protein [Cytophagales bacterium]HNP76478.1 heavy metal-binding domain-containing protein [Cyclobacteriaceae bacterium]
MKNPISLFTGVFITLFSATLLLSSCGGKSGKTHEHDKMTNDTTQMVYACPMHPEVTGKAGDVCSKCNMKLEAVKGSDTTKMHNH